MDKDELQELKQQLHNAMTSQGLAGRLRADVRQVEGEHSKSLCNKCTFSWRYRRDGSHEVKYYCLIANDYGGSSAQVVPPDITDCSRFTPQVHQMTKEEMAHIAILIDPRPDEGTGTYL